jgi:hypothetical protein
MNKPVRLAALICVALVICALSAVASWLVSPTVHAQNCPVGPSMPEINDVQPGTIVNTTAVTITVIGDGFEEGAVVVLDGYGALATTCVNATLMTATVPAGVPGAYRGRDYDVRVINPTNPEDNRDVLEDALTVFTPVSAKPSEPTKTPVPTNTPLPTEFIRPIVTIQSYGASSKVIVRGHDIDFEMTLENTGQITATNVVATFISGDLVPRATGGVRSVGSIAPGQTSRFFQPFTVSENIGPDVAIMQVLVEYTDQYGVAYSETFDLSFPVSPSPEATVTPTLTPTPRLRPQLIIEGYTTSPDAITPGTTFRLNIDLVNVSDQPARRVFVRLGESAAMLGPLAPLGSTNVRYMEVVAPGERFTLSYDLVVDGDAESGVVLIDTTLQYDDGYDVTHTEVETISLQVFGKPHFQVDLFEPLPETIFVGDTFELPVEVINIGQGSVNVSIVDVHSEDLHITDGVQYVGPLDGGTSGSVIATAEAAKAGSAVVEVRVHYLDNFQQPQVFTHVLTFEIQQIEEELPEGENSQPEGELTFGQRVWRAILGFLGLGTRPVEESPAGRAGGGGGQ